MIFLLENFVSLKLALPPIWTPLKEVISPENSAPSKSTLSNLASANETLLF